MNLENYSMKSLRNCKKNYKLIQEVKIERRRRKEET